MQENIEDFGVEPRIYELGYLIRPDIVEDKVEDEVAVLKGMFEKAGGIFISEEAPRLIELAYEMRPTLENKKYRFTNGYFGWMKYEVSPEAAEQINKDLKFSTIVFRFLLIKTIRENTVVSKKPLPRAEKPKVESAEEVAVAEVVDEKELDKEIDSLIQE